MPCAADGHVVKASLSLECTSRGQETSGTNGNGAGLVDAVRVRTVGGAPVRIDLAVGRAGHDSETWSRSDETKRPHKCALFWFPGKSGQVGKDDEKRRKDSRKERLTLTLAWTLALDPKCG